MSYTPHRPWHRLPPRRLRRMEPNWIYYAVLVGAATAVGIGLDMAGLTSWWLPAALGAVGAWAVTWVTALDDVRHPVRSLRVLLVAGRDPMSRIDARVRRHAIPLLGPPDAWGGSVRLSGGGSSHGPGLFSPTFLRARLEWTDGERGLELETATVRIRRHRSSRGSDGPFPPGLDRLSLHEEELTRAGVSSDDLAARLRAVDLRLDGTSVTATLLDLRPWVNEWLATVPISDRYRLTVSGWGVEPDEVELTHRTL